MMIHRAFCTVFLFSAALSLVACGDDSGAEFTPKVLTLELDTSAVRVRRGDTATVRVAIRPSKTIDELTILRATQLPPGVTAGDVVLQPGASAAAELTFAASASTTLGSGYAAQIEATIGEEVLTASVELTVAGLPGEPDSSFGGDGITALEAEELEGISMMEFVVSQSGIYGLLEPYDNLAERIFRVDSNGTFDRTFGTEGVVEISVPNVGYTYSTLAASPNENRIMVVTAARLPETAGTTVTVQCLDPKGRFVSSCDQEGSFAVPTDWTEGSVGTVNRFEAAVDRKGRLGMALMATAPDGGGAIIHLFRFLPDGTLDPTFEGAGIVSAPVDAHRLSSLLPLDDGGYLLIGDRTSLDEPTRGFALRFTEAGAVDVDFGTDGFVALEANTTDAAQTPDGRFYIGGMTGPPHDGIVWGLDERGQPLEGFGDDGVLEFLDRHIFSIATGPEGSVYVPTIEINPGRTASSIMRITADGTLDTNFADRTTQLGLHARSVHVGPDGNLWVGYRVPTDDIHRSNVAVGRFWL